jgi:hypothetical protein
VSSAARAASRHILYDPYTNLTRKSPPKQPAPAAAATCLRRAHAVRPFGAQFSDDPHTWAYDLRKNEWRDLKPATQPPTDRNDAVLTYDSVNGVVIAVVRAVDRSEGKEVAAGHCETWAFDAGKNTWTRMKPAREVDGWPNRRRVITFVPDQNVALLEAYINPTDRAPGAEREQQVWTYRYAEPNPMRAAPPTGLRVTTTGDTATVSWNDSASDGVTGYTIFRFKGMVPWEAELLPKFVHVRKGQTSFGDPDLTGGTVTITHAVHGITGRTSEPALARTQPRVVDDVVAENTTPADVESSRRVETRSAITSSGHGEVFSETRFCD